jgi:hypothetical protein
MEKVLPQNVVWVRTTHAVDHPILNFRMLANCSLPRIPLCTTRADILPPSRSLLMRKLAHHCCWLCLKVRTLVSHFVLLYLMNAEEDGVVGRSGIVRHTVQNSDMSYNSLDRSFTPQECRPLVCLSTPTHLLSPRCRSYE